MFYQSRPGRATFAKTKSLNWSVSRQRDLEHDCRNYKLMNQIEITRNLLTKFNFSILSMNDLKIGDFYW